MDGRTDIGWDAEETATTVKPDWGSEMDRGNIVLVACVIESGAFSGERVFRLKLADGTDYSGVTPAHYCHDKERRVLARDQPQKGQWIEGYIMAFLIANGGDQATVELPNGEAVEVPASQVPFRQAQDREAQYVPLGS